LTTHIHNKQRDQEVKNAPVLAAGHFVTLAPEEDELRNGYFNPLQRADNTMCNVTRQNMERWNKKSKTHCSAQIMVV
jgi:hypothetical protein